ncbi:MAG: hypothetical protein ABUS51_07910 [Acidobacteriota bacterium]
MVFLGAVLLCRAAVCAADDTPLPALAQLASALSRNDAVAAAGVFDESMKDFATIESALEALAAQSDILCAVDVVSDREEGDFHSLDVDWYMELKSRTPSGPTERRRERVALRMRKIRGKWRITSFSPLRILAPPTIP